MYMPLPESGVVPMLNVFIPPYLTLYTGVFACSRGGFY